jgi:hypothetical protein
MSNEELVGRVAALEVIAMTALGLHLANARQDPDYRKSGRFLANMRDALNAQAATLPVEAQKHATGYGNHLLDAVANNLRFLRGDDSSLN